MGDNQDLMAAIRHSATSRRHTTATGMPQPSVCFLFDLVSGATSDIETPTFVAADDQKRINTKPD
jgi:hypothetical protein